jgi:hypothetical protein
LFKTEPNLSFTAKTSWDHSDIAGVQVPRNQSI